MIYGLLLVSFRELFDNTQQLNLPIEYFVWLFGGIILLKYFKPIIIKAFDTWQVLIKEKGKTKRHSKEKDTEYNIYVHRNQTYLASLKEESPHNSIKLSYGNIEIKNKAIKSDPPIKPNIIPMKNENGDIDRTKAN